MINIADYVNIFMITKNKKVKRFKKSDKESYFSYDNADYNINPKKIFLYKRKPTLLYFEGFSEPLSFEDIRVVSADKSKKAVVELRAEDIHNFASKRILSVLAHAQDDNIQLFIYIVLIILVIANIMATVVL